MSNPRSKMKVPMARRYGFFRCTNCGKTWESSQVYCKIDTKKVLFQQDCKACGTACNPYKVDEIHCDEDMDPEHHVDPKKPHRADLCHKCRAGLPCDG